MATLTIQKHHVNSSDLELYKLSFSRFRAKLSNEKSYRVSQEKTLRELLFLNSENDYTDNAHLN